MQDFILVGWYKIYALEEEIKKDALNKIGEQNKRNEADKNNALQLKIERAQCDD